MTSKTRKHQGADFDESQVESWLLEQPDFFARHPRCLSAMDLPVESGPAISLHQYQVRVLRDEKSQLTQKLGVLVKNVKTNHKIHSDLLALAGDLIGLSRDGAKMDAYLDLVRKRFALCAVGLIDREASPELFKRLKKKLGKLDSVCDNEPEEALREAVFADRADKVLSIAVVPVKQGRKVCAVLVLGADDKDRFKPGMGGEFLKLLAQLISSLL